MKRVRDESDPIGEVPPAHEEKRLQALRNGYVPIPAEGKAPRLVGWQNVDPTPSDIGVWTMSKSHATNTGFVCRGIVGIDIDVKDPRVAGILKEKALSLGNGVKPLIRYGWRPKVLLVFRINVDLRKLLTPKYVDPATGIDHQVEILALGQQFIADGIHEDTGDFYQWEGPTPFDTPRDDLPLVSPEQCKKFISEAEEILKQQGWKPIEAKEPSRKKPAEWTRPSNDNGPAERVGSVFQLINNAARRNLDAWVPKILPHAEWQPGTGAWRVTSKAFGRDLEEDLSFHPTGIRDHGEEISMSPIDAVMKWGNAASVPEAAEWLRQQLKFDPVKRLMQLMNESHAVISMNGKTVILTEGEKEISFGSSADLNQYYANVRIQQGNKDYSVAQVWMRYGSRRTYTRITFAPQGADSRSYNLWRGPSVEADPRGSCRLFLEHLLHIICNGNKGYLDWLIKWLAHTVQKPEEKPGTAVVLQGVKGCGKDTVGEYFGGIFQHHHTKLSSPEQLHGRFNGHQAQTLFLHVEEGFWAGDKAAEGKLKHLITSPVMLLEKKGVDAFSIDSFLRVFISSNEDWAVPVSANGERRFFVLRCSDAVARNKAYFDALYHEMENGGRGALLAYLRDVDLTGFNVRTPPVTDALVRQAIESLKNIDLWWYEVLFAGQIHQSGHFEEDSVDWSKEGIKTDCVGVFNRYADWMKERRYDGQALTAAKFGQKLKELAPVERIRPRARHGYVNSRQYQYSFPSLEVCREHFDRRLGHPVDWPRD